MSELKSKPMRFFATYPFEVDAKRRVQVPAKWRPSGETKGVEETEQRSSAKFLDFILFLTRIREDSYACITAIPAEIFEAYAQQVEGLPLLDTTALKMRRFLGSRSEPVTMDSMGRITLPKWMTDKVGIGQKNAEGVEETTVILRGEVDRFSIWSKQKADADELASEQENDNTLENQI